MYRCDEGCGCVVWDRAAHLTTIHGVSVPELPPDLTNENWDEYQDAVDEQDRLFDSSFRPVML